MPFSKYDGFNSDTLKIMTEAYLILAPEKSPHTAFPLPQQDSVIRKSFVIWPAPRSSEVPQLAGIP